MNLVCWCEQPQSLGAEGGTRSYERSTSLFDEKWVPAIRRGVSYIWRPAMDCALDKNYLEGIDGASTDRVAVEVIGTRTATGTRCLQLAHW